MATAGWPERPLPDAAFAVSEPGPGSANLSKDSGPYSAVSGTMVAQGLQSLRENLGAVKQDVADA